MWSSIKAACRDKTSTQQIRAVIDGVLGIGSRERLLLDKAKEIGAHGITTEEAAEVDELRKARGRPIGAKTRGLELSQPLCTVPTSEPVPVCVERRS